MKASGYLISLPERVLRSASGLAAGILRETGDVVLPAWLRRTRLYRTLVDSTLRFLIEQVGEVEGVYPGEEKLAENFLLRRTAGNGIEVAGILAFHASPVWVMAALADISGAGRQLIREITRSLAEEGLVAQDAQVETIEELLDALEKSAAQVAEAVNTPPLDVKGLRREWRAIREQVARIPAAALPKPDTLWTAWRELESEAEAQRRTVFEVSSLMALSAMRRLPENVWWLGKSAAVTARRSGELLAAALLEHYSDTLGEIHRTGYLRYWAQELRPYLRAAAKQFSPSCVSLTEKLLRRSSTPLLLLASLAGGAAAAPAPARVKPATVRRVVAPAAPRIPPAALRGHVSFLASDVLGGRRTPSPGLAVAAEYIASQFRRAGLEELPGGGGYLQLLPPESFELSLAPKKPVPPAEAPAMHNVIGILRGSDPKLSATYVVVSAHYDHVGTRAGAEGDAIYNGANDNASGVAALIEIAAAFAAGKTRPKRSIVFIAYAGEELGLIGSRYYAEHPVVPLESTVAQINMEQLGRIDDAEGDRTAMVTMTGYDYSTIAASFARLAKAAGVKLWKHETNSDRFFTFSDNEALAAKGIPAHTIGVTFEFPDYHKPGDEWQKLDYENLARVARFAFAGVAAIASDPAAPKWNCANERAAKLGKCEPAQ